MFFFQNDLAPMVVEMDNLAFIDRLWADWSPGYDAAEDLISIKAALGTPENLMAALSYYRAMFNPAYQDDELAEAQAASAMPTSVPTLYLHGRNDGCFGVDVIGDPLAFLAEGSRFEIVEDAGHFLQLQQPAVVNRLILEWLSN